MLLFTLPGASLSRYATRASYALLYQLPPRITRYEPEAEYGSLCAAEG